MLEVCDVLTLGVTSERTSRAIQIEMMSMPCQTTLLASALLGMHILGHLVLRLWFLVCHCLEAYNMLNHGSVMYMWIMVDLQTNSLLVAVAHFHTPHEPALHVFTSMPLSFMSWVFPTAGASVCCGRLAATHWHAFEKCGSRSNSGWQLPTGGLPCMEGACRCWLPVHPEDLCCSRVRLQLLHWCPAVCHHTLRCLLVPNCQVVVWSSAQQVTALTMYCAMVMPLPLPLPFFFAVGRGMGLL